MPETKNTTRTFGNIYRLIFKEKQCSRQQIAEQLNLSLPTVTASLNQLIKKNLIHISGYYESSGGRKANMYECVPDARYSVGIDITRNHLSIAIIDLNLNIIGQLRKRCAFIDSDEYYQNMASDLENLLQKHNIEQNKILGVGISLPVIIETDNKTISYATVIEVSPDVYQRISKYISSPYLLFNDANSAGLAESWSHQYDRPSAYLLLSTSVGGAFMFADSPFNGDNNRASEFGHMCIVAHGRKCYCGSNGCLDAYCSSQVLSDYTNGNLEDFFRELDSGNKRFSLIFDEYLNYLAFAVNNLRMCYDCDVIIGGTVGSHMERYIEDLRNKASHLNPFEKNANYIRTCHYKTAASAVGAAIYFINQFLMEL